jgi:hypothetical protein
MRLYLVHHAEAKREDEDPARPLTEQGWEDARRAARYASELAGVQARRIFHSGNSVRSRLPASGRTTYATRKLLPPMGSIRKLILRSGENAWPPKPAM